MREGGERAYFRDLLVHEEGSGLSTQLANQEVDPRVAILAMGFQRGLGTYTEVFNENLYLYRFLGPVFIFYFGYMLYLFSLVDMLVNWFKN